LRHKNTCKKRKQIQSEELIEQKELLERKVTELEKQLTEQKIYFETLLLEQKQLVQTYQQQIFEIAKQPKHQTNNNNNNQRIVNVVNQLAPYDLTPEIVEQIVAEHFTQEAFEKGPNELAKLVVDKILTDPETQKKKVMCTDISRRVFRYLDALVQEPQLDLGFQKTHGMIKPPLTRMNVEILQELERRGSSTIRYPFQSNHDFIWDENRFADKVINFL
jgi:hypothetical protein